MSFKKVVISSWENWEGEIDRSKKTKTLSSLADGSPEALCRIEYEDGTGIDFYAPDAKIAEYMLSQTTKIDPSKFTERYFKELVERLGHSDPLIAIIKAHLYIELLLTALLENISIKNKTHLERMQFHTKVKACMTAGLIHEDVVPSLNKLADIRNGFAHQLWPEFTETHKRDFLNVVRQSERIKFILDRETPVESFSDAVLAIYFYLFEQLLKLLKHRKLITDFWRNMVEFEQKDEHFAFIGNVPLHLVKADESEDWLLGSTQ